MFDKNVSKKIFKFLDQNLFAVLQCITITVTILRYQRLAVLSVRINVRKLMLHKILLKMVSNFDSQNHYSIITVKKEKKYVYIHSPSSELHVPLYTNVFITLFIIKWF